MRQPSPEQPGLLHLVDRAERGTLLPTEAQQLRAGITALTASLAEQQQGLEDLAALVSQWYGKAQQAKHERDQLTVSLAAVAALHQPITGQQGRHGTRYGPFDVACSGCGTPDEGLAVPYPCPTARAVAEPEPVAAGPVPRPVRYKVCALPEGAEDGDLFAITVQYRGGGRWGVQRGEHQFLGADGVWSWGYDWRDGSAEPATEAEWDEYHAGREKWLAAHRFDLPTALRLAQQAAPEVTVNGHRAADVAARAVAEGSDR